MRLLSDHRSHPHFAKVLKEYQPTESGADITIISGSLFEKVGATARFKNDDFKKPIKTARTYVHMPFILDEIDINFGEKTTRTYT